MLKEKDKVIIKSGAPAEYLGEPVTIKTIYRDLNVAIIDLGDRVLKIPLDQLEPYKETNVEIGETTDKISEGKITISGKEFCRAQLEVCTPEYIKAHCANADECTSVNWGIIAASGAIVSNLLWDYLRSL